MASITSLTAKGALVFALVSACGGEEADLGQAPAETPSPARPSGPGAAPSLPEELRADKKPEAELGAADAESAEATEEAEEATPEPYNGPYFAVTKIAAAVYTEPRFDAKKKIGYIRSGGKAPVDPKSVGNTSCRGGWYKVNDTGYVCGNSGTTDLNHPEVKFAVKPPNMDEVLPYVYARNAKNGTPLYRSVPSREQMLQYEPYLDTKKQAEAKKAKAEAEKQAKADAEKQAKAEKLAKASAEKQTKEKDSKVEKASAGSEGASEKAGDKSSEKVAKKPESTKDKPAEVGSASFPLEGEKTAEASKASQETQPTKPEETGAKAASTKNNAKQEAGSEETRKASALPPELMVPLKEGDNGDAGAPETPWWQQADAKDRLHEIKLDQLAAESDDVLASRMVAGFYVAVDKTFNWNSRTWYKTTRGLVAPSDRFWQTAGSKFQGVELGKEYKLPVAWAYGGNKTAPTYQVDLEKRSVRPKGRVNRFEVIQLTGQETELKGITYSEMANGEWVKNIHVRITKPGDFPADLQADERWIDVNVTTQTLVVFKGRTPVYATLMSSGRSSTNKKKDHSTPLGEWRVREKHITSTMDGDGTAAGDLPYSIEDVPYVMYYQGSYAIHAAFWHSNYGVKMSHGCVNLAPLDAKWVFKYADPQVPDGWHGTWSSDGRPGSRIRVHD